MTLDMRYTNNRPFLKRLSPDFMNCPMRVRYIDRRVNA